MTHCLIRRRQGVAMPAEEDIAALVLSMGGKSYLELHLFVNIVASICSGCYTASFIKPKSGATMNCVNLTNAISDPRLRGDCLLAPLRWTTAAFCRVCSARPTDASLCQKVSDVFKRAGCLLGSIGAIPSIPLALVGVVVKWIDLGLRINEFVHPGPAISYHLPMILKIFSRLGDRTVAYLNTKSVAEHYNLPVYFVPFKGCENFQFSAEEHEQGLTGPQYFKRVVHLKSTAEVAALANADRNESTLYLLPFFPFNRHLGEEGPNCSYIDHTTNWQSFRPRVGKLLQVVQQHRLIDIPDGAYPIALHIRDGSGPDDAKTKTMHPLKLPSLNFYIEELSRFLQSNNIPQGQPIFIRIFTDSSDPERIANEVRIGVGGGLGDTIQLSWSGESNLTDDIANMGRFRCMIRADSNLSGPIVLGSNTTEFDIFPTRFFMSPEWDTISISRVRMVRNHTEIDNFDTDYQKPVVQGGLPRWFFRNFWEYYGIIQSPPRNGLEDAPIERVVEPRDAILP